jgi:DNA-binding NarL/FixJ family response regulator
MKPGKSILIMAKPGALRTGLQALLQSINREHTVLFAEDRTQILELFREMPASLFILEEDRAGGKIWDVLLDVKRLAPRIKCIVLLEDVQEKSAEILADAAILKGTSPEQLVSVIESLLEDFSE